MEGRKRGRGMQPLDEIEVGGAISAQAIRQEALRVAQNVPSMAGGCIWLAQCFQGAAEFLEILGFKRDRIPLEQNSKRRVDAVFRQQLQDLVRWKVLTKAVRSELPSLWAGFFVVPKSETLSRAIFDLRRSTRISLIPGNFIFRNMKRFWPRCSSWGSRRVHGAPKGT